MIHKDLFFSQLQLNASATAPVLSARYSPRVYVMPVDHASIISFCAHCSPARLKWLSPACSSALALIFLYGMRSAELLRCTVRCLTGLDRVFIAGAKSSSSYIIVAPGIDKQFPEVAGFSDDELLFPFSYIQLYRACLKVGVGEKFKENENYSRVHMARHVIAESVNSLAGRQAAGDILHHKSKRSVSYYLPEEGVKDGQD